MKRYNNLISIGFTDKTKKDLVNAKRKMKEPIAHIVRLCVQQSLDEIMKEFERKNNE